eukprot:1989936-Pleurochrysis_carterae.AAC.2
MALLAAILGKGCSRFPYASRCSIRTDWPMCTLFLLFCRHHDDDYSAPCSAVCLPVSYTHLRAHETDSYL